MTSEARYVRVSVLRDPASGSWWVAAGAVWPLDVARQEYDRIPLDMTSEVQTVAVALFERLPDGVTSLYDCKAVSPSWDRLLASEWEDELSTLSENVAEVFAPYPITKEPTLDPPSAVPN